MVKKLKIKESFEHPYVSTYGSTDSRRSYDVTFQYPNEEEKTVYIRGIKELKELIQQVKDYDGKVISIISYDGGTSKDVTSRYVKESTDSSWQDHLPRDVFNRLSECRTRKDDIVPLAVAYYQYKLKDKGGSWTPEDALIAIWEWVDCNGQNMDFTKDEYNDMLFDINRLCGFNTLPYDESYKGRKKFKEARYSDVVPYENRKYWYFTTHGIGPGTIPPGVHILDVKEGQNKKGTWGDYICLDAILNTSELREFDLIELAPDNVYESAYSRNTFKVGDKVRSNLSTKNDANMAFGGTIIDIDKNGLCTIDCYDGTVIDDIGQDSLVKDDRFNKEFESKNMTESPRITKKRKDTMKQEVIDEFLSTAREAVADIDKVGWGADMEIEIPAIIDDEDLWHRISQAVRRDGTFSYSVNESDKNHEPHYYYIVVRKLKKDDEFEDLDESSKEYTRVKEGLSSNDTEHMWFVCDKDMKYVRAISEEECNDLVYCTIYEMLVDEGIIDEDDETYCNNNKLYQDFKDNIIEAKYAITKTPKGLPTFKGNIIMKDRNYVGPLPFGYYVDENDDLISPNNRVVAHNIRSLY